MSTEAGESAQAGTALRDTIALVTGASRGAGRGIALALGDAGATVYVTGRSVDPSATTDGLPGTVSTTAEEISARPGKGIPVRCDHTDDEETAALFERIRADEGRLDLLVNNVWGGYEAYDTEEFGAAFREQPLEKRWEGMFVAGVRAHFVASRLAIPLLRKRKADTGLIVFTTFWDRGRYLGNVYYDVAKAAVNRMAYALGRELEPHGIASIAVAPGFMRTERVMAAHEQMDRSAGADEVSVDQASIDGAAADEAEDSGSPVGPNESPQYVGRAVVALARDPAVLRHTGRTFRVGDLTREYGFTDIDGTQPPPFELPEP